MSYVFLSSEWVEAARSLREEFGPVEDAPVALAMNLNVTEVPFGDGSLAAHLDTTNGPLALDFGHLATSDLTVTVDWSTAKALLVDGNPQAAMSAFMNGKIKVVGDMAKLVALQNVTPDPRTEDVISRLRALTS